MKDNFADVCVFVGCCFATAFLIGLEWPRAPACPESLSDGRALLSHTFNGKETRCKYAPPPASYQVSPEELRRMARAKERLARVQ